MLRHPFLIDKRIQSGYTELIEYRKKGVYPYENARFSEWLYREFDVRL